MKVYQTNEIRNITLVGNAGSGKTTFAEAMLFEGGIIKRRGEVSAKNTVSDYRDIEHEQQGSVFSSVLYTEWKGKKINIIDNPGAPDFVGGAVASLSVADTALIMLNSQNGVEVGAEIAWRLLTKVRKPSILVINHLDHEQSNYEKTLDEAKSKFGSKIAVVQYPVNAGHGFNAVIDLLKMKMLKWSAEGGVAEELDIPADEQNKAAQLQEQLVESAATNDDSLMEIFFSEGTLTEDQMRQGIRIGLAKGEIVPVFCSAAKGNMGISRLMDFICNVAPCPSDVAPAVTSEGKEIKCDPAGPVSLFVFKATIEQHLGEVIFFKVMSGQIGEGVDLINTQKQSKERVSQLFVNYGKSRNKVEKIVAGDIGVTVKLKDTRFGHSLNEKDNDWIYSSITFPNSKFRTAIKAVNESEEEKLSEALQKIRFEDPTIIVEYSKELKQMIVHGQGEFHLNIVKWHLDNQYKIGIEFLPPRIPYRETITKAAQSMYRHKKQSGGAGQFGEVHMVIEPFIEGAAPKNTFKTQNGDVMVSIRDRQEYNMDWGGKLVFHNCIVGGVIENRFLPAILKGVMEKMEEGPLTGSYARDINVYVYDGKMHPVDSNEISFKLAGMNAFKQAFREAGPKIMEPIYNVEVTIPSDRMGDVMSDLQGRRALILGMESESGYEILKAKVPLAEMNRYSTALSSLTNGRATYDMTFAEYQAVPGEVQDQLLKAYDAESKDE